jgi:hypothetical protein
MRVELPVVTNYINVSPDAIVHGNHDDQVYMLRAIAAKTMLFDWRMQCHFMAEEIGKRVSLEDGKSILGCLDVLQEELRERLSSSSS